MTKIINGWVMSFADNRALMSYKNAISPVMRAIGSWVAKDTPSAVELIPSIPAAPRWASNGLSTDHIGANNP